MGAAISAGIAAAGSIAGNMMSSSAQGAANRQTYQDQLQMEQWNEQMSDTAMQRRVADLKAAGLNPLLAVSQGGASTPQMAPIQFPSAGSAWGQMGGQLTGAMQLAQQQAAIEQQRAQAQATNAQADKTRTENAAAIAELPFKAGSASNMMDQIAARTNEINQNAWKLAKEFDLTIENVQSKMTDNAFQVQYNDLRNKIMQNDYLMQQLGMQKLSNDSSFQAAHPWLSGILQNAPGMNSAAGAATSLMKVLP